MIDMLVSILNVAWLIGVMGYTSGGRLVHLLFADEITEMYLRVGLEVNHCAMLE